MMTGSKGVGLTFDDGPYPEYTPQILNLLSANGIKATFCVIGRNAQNHPDLIRRIHAEGHTLCNHSWDHDLSLAKRSSAAIRDDLNATNRAIRDAVPGVEIGYFRAPGGNFDKRLVDIAKSMGMTSLYWHVDPRDWDVRRYGHGESMVKHIVSTVQQRTRSGSIVLSHDAQRPDTVTAYQKLLPWLKDRFTLIALPPGGQLPRP